MPVRPLQTLREHVATWLRRRLLQAYSDVFGGEAGRVVLADILEHGHVLESTYVRGDSHETAVREGERSLALHIIGMLKTDIESLGDLVAEERNRVQAYGRGGQ